MSELIDQLRSLRALAYRKLTQNSDFKVLMELDQMLARLDPSDEAMAPPPSPESDSGEDDADTSDDTEAAPPEPVAKPPPEPERKEILLASGPADEGPAIAPQSTDDGSEEVESDEEDIRAEAAEEMAPAEEAGDPEPEAAAQPEEVIAAEALDDAPAEEAAEPETEPAAETLVAEATADVPQEPAEADSEADVIGEIAMSAVVEALASDDVLGDEPLMEETLADDAVADSDDEEAAFASALADEMGVEVDAEAIEEAEEITAPEPEPEHASARQSARAAYGLPEEDAATAVAAALDATPPPVEPAPVAFAPEEDYDAAVPSGSTESSDAAYESALNRLNALIERASHRLKRDEGQESNGATAG